MTPVAKYFRIAVWAASSLILTSCEKDAPDLSDVVVIVTPSADTKIELSSGEKVQYSLEISTIHDYVTNLRITSFDRQNGEIVLDDLDCNQKKFRYKFIYTAPQLDSHDSEALLTFTVTDNQGNEATATRTIAIHNKMVSLKEITGIVLYAPGPGLPDALSLENVTQTFNLADSPTPEIADIFMSLNERTDELAWESNTHTKFLRNNTFNYAEASAKSISSVYESSTRQDNMRDIKVNDIIFVGHGTTAEGVFMVANVIQSAGRPFCIHMNYKGIRLEDSDTEDSPDSENDTIEGDNPAQSR